MGESADDGLGPDEAKEALVNANANLAGLSVSLAIGAAGGMAGYPAFAWGCILGGALVTAIKVFTSR